MTETSAPAPAAPQLDFAGKVVFITGATTGIGQSVAEAFAALGAKVFLASRRVPEETLVRIRAAGGTADYAQCDVTKPEQIAAAIDRAVEVFGRLDIAFNNAGVLPVTAPLLEQTLEDFEWTIATDLTGVFVCMQHEVREMLKVGGGSIINTASVAGVVADPGMSPYVAAKHGVVGLTEAAALEYAQQNIRINAVAPAFVRTPMTEGWLEDPAMREAVKGFNAQGRAADPDEIVGMVLLLASPMASFMTGGVYAVDGGQTAH